MTVRETEKYLPRGGATGLGQFTTVGKYSLVSYLSTPVPQGLRLNYVVFAIDDAPADQYAWTILSIPSGTVKQVTTPSGSMDFVPAHLGVVYVQVQVLVNASVGSQVVATLGLQQEVIEPSAHLFSFVDTVAATVGWHDTSMELIHAFKPYILEPVQDAAYSSIPAGFLASVVYAGADAVGPDKRSTDLMNLERELNGVPPTSNDKEFGPRLGVCQLHPEIVAMVAMRPGTGPQPTYTTPWQEPATEAVRESTNTLIRTSYNNLPPRDKIDLYNLIRFPKSNIRMCLALLVQLKKRTHRWPALTAADLLNPANEGILRILATEFRAQTSPAPRPANVASPVGNEAKPDAKGTKVAGLLNKPFIFVPFGGRAEIAGEVVDATTGNAIVEAKVDLYRAVAKITGAAQKRPCFTQPLVGSSIVIELKKGQVLPVIEVRRAHPDANTDWLQVDTPLGGGWIKARDGAVVDAVGPYFTRVEHAPTSTDSSGEFRLEVTRNHLYKVRAVKTDYFDGEVLTPAPEDDVTIEMHGAAGTIREAEIIQRLNLFTGFGYDLIHPNYPYGLWPNFLLIAGTGNPPKARVNNCSAFTCGLLVKSWQEDAIQWLDQNGDPVVWVSGDDRYYQWMIKGFDPLNDPVALQEERRADRFSTLRVANEMGMTSDVITVREGTNEANVVPPPWSLVQGFTNPQDVFEWATGHSLIIVDRYSVNSNPDDDKILTLESNVPATWNGPGFRGIGHIDNQTGFSPGKEWFLKPNVPTWRRIKDTWPYLRFARLKVNDLNWVR